jgi:hypothetical protein
MMAEVVVQSGSSLIFANIDANNDGIELRQTRKRI